MTALLTVGQAADRLGLSYWMTLRMVHRGEIPASKFGGPKRPTFRIRPESLETVIEQQRVVQPVQAKRPGRRPADVIEFYR